MTKFKVGDTVRIIKGHDEHKDGAIKVIDRIDENNINGWKYGFENMGGWTRENNLELVKSKPTKNQRITALENKVTELELIVHELRERPQLTTVINNAPQEPSTTNTVEDIIEFEGKQYRKVDREAREGDVVVFTKISRKNRTTDDVQDNKPYEVRLDLGGRMVIEDDDDCELYVYGGGVLEGTPETVDVYEIIEGGLNPQIPMVDETVEPLTPNQQRAAIIEKAKVFVKNILGEYDTFNTTIGKYRDQCVRPKFHVNEKKRAITVLIYGAFGKQLIFKGLAKCNPSDVYNKHIGKAIALGRALGLDVCEFENAPQPNRRTDGMVIEWRGGIRVISTIHVAGETCDFDSEFARYGTIINDTNAKYGGVEQC